MTEVKKTAKKTAQKKTAAKTAAKRGSTSGFTAPERAAMKERAEELRASGRGGTKKADDANAVLAKIAEMSQPDRRLAERIHAIISSTVPDLLPKTWYGMPAYARDGKIVCFFQPAEKFGARYSTLGFNDEAKLDDGTMWPTAFAVTELQPADEKRIAALIKQAAN